MGQGRGNRRFALSSRNSLPVRRLGTQWPNGKCGPLSPDGARSRWNAGNHCRNDGFRRHSAGNHRLELSRHSAAPCKWRAAPENAGKRIRPARHGLSELPGRRTRTRRGGGPGREGLRLAGPAFHNRRIFRRHLRLERRMVQERLLQEGIPFQPFLPGDAWRRRDDDDPPQMRDASHKDLHDAWLQRTGLLLRRLVLFRDECGRRVSVRGLRLQIQAFRTRRPLREPRKPGTVERDAAMAFRRLENQRPGCRRESAQGKKSDC